MPIGWESGDGRIVSWRSPAVRAVTTAPSWWDRVAGLTLASAAVISRDELVHRDIEAVLWTRWVTAFDERVCPVCGPYAGRVWPSDDGPFPPLHPNCRCGRVYAFTTWRTRS